MAGQLPRLRDRLIKPEYTGENRCVPCTVVNLVLAVLVSAAVSTVAIELAAAVLAVSVGLIYVRGYLLPGTPELTKRYLPERVLLAFGKHPADADPEEGLGESDAEDGPTFETLERIEHHRENKVEPRDYLREAAVIETVDGGRGDYRFTEAFTARLSDRIADVCEDGVDAAAIAPLFDVSPDEIEPLDRDQPAYEIGNRIRSWISDVALHHDVATYRALADATGDWETVPMEQRLDVLEWLRTLQDTCPACSGAVRFSDDVLESCCGRFSVTTMSCADCGERLREFNPRRVSSRDDLSHLSP